LTPYRIESPEQIAKNTEVDTTRKGGWQLQRCIAT